MLDLFILKSCGRKYGALPPTLLTLPKHGSFAVLVKTSKCPVSLSCATDRTHRARISNPTASSEDRVSGRKCHRPRTSKSVAPLPRDQPACGAAFSLDDLHATSLRSSRRRFSAAEHLLVLAGGRTDSHAPGGE